jgi:hypothetical protein
MPSRGTWLAVASIVLATACTGPTPTPTVASSLGAKLPASPIATPMPILSQTAGGWTLAAVGDAAPFTQFTAVTSVEDGFVVVGSSGSAADRPIAAHSADGTTWTSESIDGSGIVPSTLIDWRTDLLAVGAGETSRCAHPFGMATWVRSSAGIWSAPSLDQDLCAGGGPSAVVLGGRAWLVGDGTADVPYLMDTNDGIEWTDHRQRVGNEVFIDRAVAADDGLWIVGRAGDEHPVALHSRDGTKFTTEALVDDAGRPIEVVAPLTVRGTLALLAARGDAIGLLTRTATGGWTEAQVVGLPRVGLSGVGLVGSTFVAFGSDELKPPGWWSSNDGIRWQAIPRPDEADVTSPMLGVAVGHGLAVAVGRVPLPDGSGLVGAIWTGPETLLVP